MDALTWVTQTPKNIQNLYGASFPYKGFIVEPEHLTVVKIGKTITIV